MGRKKYAAEMLEWTCSMGQNVAAVVTDAHFPNSPTAMTARELGLPVVTLAQAEELVTARGKEIDFAVSYLFWQKIREPLITGPRLGCINFHPALLPDWKGVGGYNLAILNKLPQWGASAHMVDTGLDTGDIIEVFKFSFDHRLETAQSLERKTQLLQCELYKSVMLDVFLNGRLTRPLKPNRGGRYLSKKELLAMMRVDPQIDDVDLKTRAFWFPPYHGAYIEVGGVKYTLTNDLILRQMRDKNQTADI
jgi:methionyl-tRNA formyltransferase